VAAVMIPIGIAAPQLQTVRESVTRRSHTGLNEATRGRFKLVTTGLRIAEAHPLAGVGVGGFGREFVKRVPAHRMKDPASHTAPVTIAAETGIVGLAVFAWLVAAGLVVAFRRTRAGPNVVRIAGLAAGLCLAAIFVHSLFYSAFLEDPLVWGFLALAALAARESAHASG
jgi:O-antigen ligase